MLEVSQIQANRQQTIDALKKRHLDAEQRVNDVIELEDKRRHAQVRLNEN